MKSEMIPKQTGFVTSFDGTPIYYEVRGKGRPLVLTYGIACGTNHWRHQIKYFSQKYMTIVFDFRGHGKSGVPSDRENLTLDALSKDTKAVIDHLNLETASFWGHSFGAQILIRAYDMFPERFSNMVFINGFATN